VLPDDSNLHGMSSTPSLVGLFYVRIISSVCFEIKISDWQDGSKVSSIICDLDTDSVGLRLWLCRDECRSIASVSSSF